jgi:hypothetical protein
VTRQAQQLARDVPLLNQHQRSIYNNVIDAVHDPKPVNKTFFVDGLGGAGKTFLYRCLLSRVRSTGDIALLMASSMASSGIAALLLEGGCIAHSRFKIPIAGLCGSSACYVPLNSPQAALIRVARLIVWDEAPMAHKHVFEAMNRTLQHVMGAVDPALKDMLFGARLLSWEVILGKYCLWFPGAREAKLWMPVSRGPQSFGIVLKCVSCMKTCVFRGFWHRVEPMPRLMLNNNKLGQTTCNALGRA